LAISAIHQDPKFLFFQKNGKKINKSWRPTKKMCLLGVNFDVLTLELDMKVQIANF
jgi:hypothetical protein